MAAKKKKKSNARKTYAGATFKGRPSKADFKAAHGNMKKAWALHRAKKKGGAKKSKKKSATHTKTTRKAAKKSGGSKKKKSGRKGKHPSKADFQAAGGNMKKAWALYHARHGGKKPKAAKKKKKSHASKSGSHSKTTRKAAKRGKSKSSRRAGSTSVRSDLTVNVRGPSGPARRGKKRKGGSKRKGKAKGSRAREHYMAENPLGAGEMILGGFTGVLGFIVGDGVDRFLATHALTDKGSQDANGNELYADAVPTSGSYSGLYNATAIAAPMDLLRWGVGLGVPIVVVLGGRMISHPLGRSGVQMFGFVWGVRTLGKGLTDLVAYLTRSKSFGQRLYDAEMRAASQMAGSTGYPLSSLPSTGLGSAKKPCCANCAKGLPCSGKEQPPAPPPPPTGYAGLPLPPKQAMAEVAAPPAQQPQHVSRGFGLYSPRHARHANRLNG